MNLATESIGMAGFVTNVAGNMLLTRKNPHGWWVRLVSNVLWTIYAGTEGSFSVNVNHAVFFALNIYGWWEWSRAPHDPKRVAPERVTFTVELDPIVADRSEESHVE